MCPRSRPRCASATSATLALFLSIGACASAPEAPPERLLVDSQAFVGTVLSGPLSERDPAQLDWDGSWLLEARVSYATRVPRGERAVSGRLVLREGARELLGTRSELAARVRHLPTSFEAPRSAIAWSEDVALALPAGATMAISATPNTELLHGPTSAWTRWSLETSRSAERRGSGSESAVQLALVLEGSVVPRGDGDEDDEPFEGARANRDPIHVRERIVLEPALVPGGEGLHLAFAAPQPGAPRGAYLLRLRLVDRPGAHLTEAIVARSRTTLEAQHAVAPTTAARGEGEFQFESQSALRSMRRHELQRPALIFLAQTTGARLCEDLALVAGPEALGEFLTHTGQLEGDAQLADAGPAAFGWLLERSALEWLALRAEDESGELEPELAGLWWRHTGELGSFPDMVREALARCADREQLVQLFVEENRLFLEDTHPAARVRAYDWLALRQLAPADFDPLGPRAERRDALHRAAAELEAAARATAPLEVAEPSRASAEVQR